MLHVVAFSSSSALRQVSLFFLASNSDSLLQLLMSFSFLFLFIPSSLLSCSSLLLLLVLLLFLSSLLFSSFSFPPSLLFFSSHFLSLPTFSSSSLFSFLPSLSLTVSRRRSKHECGIDSALSPKFPKLLSQRLFHVASLLFAFQRLHVQIQIRLPTEN